MGVRACWLARQAARCQPRTSRAAHCASVSSLESLPRGKPQPASFFQPRTSRIFSMVGSSRMAPLQRQPQSRVGLLRSGRLGGRAAVPLARSPLGATRLTGTVRLYWLNPSKISSSESTQPCRPGVCGRRGVMGGQAAGWVAGRQHPSPTASEAVRTCWKSKPTNSLSVSDLRSVYSGSSRTMSWQGGRSRRFHAGSRPPWVPAAQAAAARQAAGGGGAGAPERPASRLAAHLVVPPGLLHVEQQPLKGPGQRGGLGSGGGASACRPAGRAQAALHVCLAAPAPLTRVQWQAA